MGENEDKIKISEKKYRSLFNYSIAGIAFHKIVYDSNQQAINYLITDLNPMYEKLLQIKKEDSLEKLATEVYKTKSAPYLDIYSKVAETMEPVLFTNFFEPMEKYFKISVFSFEKGTFVTMFEDFTEQIRAEKLLQERAEMVLRESSISFRNIVDSSPMGIHMYQLEPDGRLVFIGANRSADKILGIDNNQFIGKTIEEAFPSLIETEVPQRYKNAASKGTPWTTEKIVYEDKQISGAFEVHAFQTSPEKMASFFLDITERKKAGQKLKESEKNLKISEKKYRDLSSQLQIIFDNFPAAIFLYDLKGEFLLVNKYLAEALNTTKENMINKTNYDFFPKVQADRQKIIDLEVIKNKKTVEYIDSIDTPNGRRWGLNLKIPLIDKNGNLYSILGIAQDITNLKKAEERIKESEEKYRQAYHLAEFYKDLFAHDISNLLQNVLSSIELSSFYLSSNKGVDIINDLFNGIKEQVKKGAILVSNVRKLSNLEKSNLFKEKISINECLEQSIKNLEDFFPHKKIDIKIDTNNEIYHVNASEYLVDAFNSILLNAVNHNNNEIVTIKIKLSKQQRNNDEFVKIELIDNGKGIVDSRKIEIFERERKLDYSISGIGLGLSIVKRIVENHKGKAWVEDRVQGDFSKGSNFIILIPITIVKR